MASTLVLIIFAALSAGSYGANGSVPGLFTTLTIYRFFLGVGIGGEYPAGSVAAAESAGELKRGHRNRWFIMFTNVQINLGFVLAAFVPMVVVLVFTENHLRTAWRVMLGLGVLPPLSLLYLRMKLREPENFNRERMHKYPVKLIARYIYFPSPFVNNPTVVACSLVNSKPTYRFYWWRLVRIYSYPICAEQVQSFNYRLKLVYCLLSMVRIRLFLLRLQYLLERLA